MMIMFLDLCADRAAATHTRCGMCPFPLVRLDVCLHWPVWNHTGGAAAEAPLRLAQVSRRCNYVEYKMIYINL